MTNFEVNHVEGDKVKYEFESIKDRTFKQKQLCHVANAGGSIINKK